MNKTILRYTLRVEKHLLEKLHYIADYEGRSANREIERLIKNRIREFETEYGKIKIGED